MAVRVPPATLDDIRHAIDIVTLIGSYFHLNRSGSSFKALCPFHKEKTPSFLVNPQRQIFRCFGCGAAGDVFRFVMDYEKVDFMTAVKMLAQRAGVRLAFDERDEPAARNKEMLYEIHEKTARFFHEMLKKPDGEAGRDYLARRSLDQQAIDEFAIGFAPDRWDGLLHSAGKKYSLEQLEASGLIVKSTRSDTEVSYYDRFRNRLMFPIHDEQGRVIGFSGRTLEADPKAAKYVNSPETPLFHKGRVLYALHLARQAIVESREAIVCEGQIDVIRCHRAGIPSAIAAQGTAFTDDHARIVKRYADSVVLVFDADHAGQDAAVRAAEIFLQAGLAVRIAELPAGEDPDSLILKHGAERFRSLLNEAKSVLDFQIDLLSRRDKLDTEAGLMRVSRAVLETINRIPNAVFQARAIQQAAGRLNLPEDAFRKEFERMSRRDRRPAENAAETPPPPSPQSNREMALCEHLASDPALAALVRDHLPLDLVAAPLCRQLIRAVLDSAETGKDLMSVITEQDNEEQVLGRFAAQVLTAPAKIKSEFATGEESVKCLILSIWTQFLQDKRKTIRKQMQSQSEKDKPSVIEHEHSQLGCDIAKLKNWESALPILELLTLDYNRPPQDETKQKD